MLGFFVTMGDVGIYDVAFSVAIFSLFPYLALMKTAEVFSMKLITDESSNSFYQRDLQLATFFSLIICIWGCFFGDVALWFFGYEFQAGFRTLCILMVGFAIVTMFGMPIQILAWNKMYRAAIGITVGCFFLNVTLNAYLIPLMGIDGAAVASIISLLLSRLLSAALVRRLLKFNAVIEEVYIGYALFILSLVVSSLYLLNYYVGGFLKYGLSMFFALFISMLTFWLWRRNGFLMGVYAKFF